MWQAFVLTFAFGFFVGHDAQGILRALENVCRRQKPPATIKIPIVTDHINEDHEDWSEEPSGADSVDAGTDLLDAPASTDLLDDEASASLDAKEEATAAKVADAEDAEVATAEDAANSLDAPAGTGQGFHYTAHLDTTALDTTSCSCSS